MKSRKMLTAGLITAVLGLVAILPVAAQDSPGTIARFTEWSVRDGMVDDFEAGLKAHNAFHAGLGDPVPLFTWEIVTGKDAGNYLRGSLGHHWADFDNHDNDEADAEDSAVNLDPYIASGDVKIWQTLPAISRLPEGEIAPLAQISHFHLEMTGQRTFIQGIGKIHAAIDKTGWGGDSIWYTLVDGGSTPTFALVLPHANWADFADPEVSFMAMLTEAYGAEEAGALMESLAGTVKHRHDFTVAFRKDLSYIPAAE